VTIYLAAGCLYPLGYFSGQTKTRPIQPDSPDGGTSSRTLS